MATSDAKPATSDVKLPLIDFSGYFHPKSPEDKAKVIAEVRHAATEFGKKDFRAKLSSPDDTST